MDINITYLMNKYSRKLHTIIRHITGEKSISLVCLRMDLDDKELFTRDLLKYMIENATGNIPFICDVDNRFIYASVKLGSDFFIIGPIKYNPNYSLVNVYNSKSDVSGFNDIYSVVSILGWDDYLECLLDFSNIFSCDAVREITEIDIVNANCISKDFLYKIHHDLTYKIIEQQETGQHHNPYDQEIRELSAIENGDVEALKKSLAEDYTGQIGTLAKDSLRNIKNVALIVVATSSRAAIKGGISPEVAFSMADLYSQQIEETTTENIPMQITRNAEFEYAKMVRRLKDENSAMNSYSGEENEHIMATKNYVFKHLHGKLSVQEIADAIGVNANYLSGLFKEKEQITLKEYILKNKINLVKNMLTYSAYSYTEIAYYLGFSSQSHLGKQFKEKTGMTLSQYRLKYQLQEFMD